jgi:precorrin-6B methylase 1
MRSEEPTVASLTTAGSLDVVGLGFLGTGQITPEALSCVRNADKVFYLGADALCREWLRSENATLESLYDAYSTGKNRLESYEEMIQRMLAPVRAGMRVCVAFYGHPGVFVYPSHEAIARARNEGHSATMYPAISAEDCLFADLEVDPADFGCASYEATDFLVRPRRVDTSAALILWQAGGIGVTTYENGLEWNPGGVRLLTERLIELYGPAHEVVVYEAAVIPVCDPVMIRVRVEQLPTARVSVYSTLYVPPLVAHKPMQPEDLLRVGQGIFS